jgi:DME family drug/metabolite transporter
MSSTSFERTGERVAIVAVLAAACCWATLGIAYDFVLERFPMSRLTVVAVRATVAGGVLLAFVLTQSDQRRYLPVAREPRMLALLTTIGLVATTLFYVALIYAYREAGVAIGTVLLYLSPSFVALGGWFWFQRPVTRAHATALVIAFIGVIGVSGAFDGGASVAWLGLLLGIVSALSYASYSLLGEVALRRLPGLLIVAVELSIGALGLWAVRFAVEGSELPAAGALVGVGLITGFAVTLVPMVLYTHGLERIGASRASMLAVAEPVVAVGLAYIVLGERLSWLQVVGATAIVLSLIAVVRSRSKK